MADVSVGCSVQAPCTGSIDVLLDGQVAGTGPFSIESPHLYADVWVEVTGEVAALIKRRDPRISAAVTTGATGVRRQAGLPVLGKSLPILPIINNLPLGSG